jgi:AcrR family transcriptional regulator
MMADPRPTIPTRFFADTVEGRRGEILDAALAVFGEKGYEAGTMREIARRVGVTEPALYRHYESKEALFEDVIAEAGGAVTRRARVMLDGVEATHLRETLTLLVVTRRREGHSIKPILHTLMMAAPHNEVVRDSLRTHVAGPMSGNIRSLIDRIDGELGIVREPAELEGTLRVFMSLFIGYMVGSMLFDNPADAAIVDAIIAIMGWENAEL